MHDTLHAARRVLGRNRDAPVAPLPWLAHGILALCALAGVEAARASSAPLTAAQIVARNVAARGGVEAWRKIQTLVWSGQVVSPNAPQATMPFVLQQKRPNKTRFEVTVNGQRSLRVFNGSEGWKVVPTHEGRPDIRPYNPQELTFAREGQGIDGPLIDHEAKGIIVTLEGSDKVEGRKAYRLKVRLPLGQSHHVWVDAQNFLDIKYDRTSYNAAGVAGTVSVFYRNYQAVGGLQIPGVIETSSGSDKPGDRLVIEKVGLNPPLDEANFEKPGGARSPRIARPGAAPSPPATASEPGPEATPR